MNDVKLSGRFVADPEKVGSGENVGATFTVAVQDGWGEKKYTSFFSCVAWAKSAESILKYIKKGDGIVISKARIKQQRWEKDGKKLSKIGVIVEQYEFPMTKKDQEPTEEAKKETQGTFNADEIPF